MPETEGILKLIDDATAPDQLSKEEAKDFLEELEAELRSRLDALEEEIEEEEHEETLDKLTKLPKE